MESKTSGLGVKMGNFYKLACKYCLKLTVVILPIAGILLIRVVKLLMGQDRQPIQVQDSGQIWTQVITAGIVLVIGAAVIKMFFNFKEESSKQAIEDRETTAEKMTELKGQLQELVYILRGVEGHGGILNEITTNRERRHVFGSTIMKLQSTLIEVLELLAVICQKLDIPFDHRLISELGRTPRE